MRVENYKIKNSFPLFVLMNVNIGEYKIADISVAIYKKMAKKIRKCNKRYFASKSFNFRNKSFKEVYRSWKKLPFTSANY